MKLGIVGHGFVGSSINQGFTKNVKKYIVDPKYYSANTIESLIQLNLTQLLWQYQLHN